MWLSELQSDLQARRKANLTLTSSRNRMEIATRGRWAAETSALATALKSKLRGSYQAMNFPDPATHQIAPDRYRGRSETAGRSSEAPIANPLTGPARNAPRESMRGRREGLSGSTRDLGLVARISPQHKQCCFPKAGAVVEIAAVPKGRKSAKRPNARRSQGRPGEPLAPSTSTGKWPRSAIHESEVHTFVTGGVHPAWSLDQLPLPRCSCKQQNTNIKAFWRAAEADLAVRVNLPANRSA